MHRKKNIDKKGCRRIIAQTGIWVGELKFVTVEAVKEEVTIVRNKGKCRMLYFTDNLCQEL